MLLTEEIRNISNELFVMCNSRAMLRMENERLKQENTQLKHTLKVQPHGIVV